MQLPISRHITVERFPEPEPWQRVMAREIVAIIHLICALLALTACAMAALLWWLI